MFFVMHSSIPLTFLATRAQCQLKANLLSNRTLRSFIAELLLKAGQSLTHTEACGYSSPDAGLYNCACWISSNTSLLNTPVCPGLEEGSTAFWRVYHYSQLGTVSKLKSRLDHYYSEYITTRIYCIIVYNKENCCISPLSYLVKAKIISHFSSIWVKHWDWLQEMVRAWYCHWENILSSVKDLPQSLLNN